eukprot:TRINITY_DN2697_c0_g1_i1.p1 TRINITY_DN2697_c0_g1~~TRINITY_DN2697_c0_g1_i1.p1  ORF type:complete len:204 (+),score=21.80 TRINITY_DN2697_c0_g1_i1:71-682(+)
MSHSNAYGKASYWDDRYSRDLDPFDWYQRFGGIKHLISKSVKHAGRVLIVGCGTSRLSEDMLKDGFKDIVNIDVSSVVISHMTEKYKDTPGLIFRTMDVMSMEFSDSAFDAVVDKGTLDAILCGENSTANADSMVSEIYRVLKPGGTYVVVTYGAPKMRLQYLEKPKFNWKVEVATIAKPQGLASQEKQKEEDVHYTYILTKL